MAIAGYRGAEFGCVLVITDEPFAQWTWGFAGEEVKRVKRIVAEKAMVILGRVSACQVGTSVRVAPEPVAIWPRSVDQTHEVQHRWDP